MIIPGYLDGYEPPFAQSPLVDGSAMMSDTVFWPAFLSTVGGSATAPEAFSADPDEVRCGRSTVDNDLLAAAQLDLNVAARLLPPPRLA